MNFNFRPFDLQLTRRWMISSGVGPGGGGGTNVFKVAFVELRDENGVIGLGETAPSSRYGETVESGLAFFSRVDGARLTFDDVEGSMAYLEGLAPGQHAAKGALNMAVMDGAARKMGRSIYDVLGLGFSENKHVTSFSIGIDKPDVIREKVLEADRYPVLKLKVGGPDDRQNLAALREVAPTKRLRVDANEAWATRETALKNLEWLAADGHIEFVEQPMPATTNPDDIAWLKSHSPLPIMADESYVSVADLSRVADCYHAVNVKLVKAGGIQGSFEALKAARNVGLKTMLGCMIESSILITAAAHLAELTDYLDIDGNLLISNDPFMGATADGGVISFARTPDKTGLRVRPRG